MNNNYTKYAPYFMMLAVFVMLYFPIMSDYTVSVDDEFGFWRDNALPWISQGRIISFLIEKYIINQPTIVYFNELFLGICFVFSYFFVLKAFKKENIEAFDILAFGLFCGFPVWYFIVEFYSNLPAISVGILFSCLGIYFFSKVTDDGCFSRNTIFSIIFVVLAISSYQSYLFYCVAGFIAIYIHRYKYIASVKKLFIGSVIIILSATTIYYVVLKFFLLMNNVGIEYINNFFILDLLINEPLEKIYDLLKLTFRFVFDNKKLFVFYFPAVTIFSLLFYFLMLKNKHIFNFFIAITLVFLPFVMKLVAHDWPIRAQLVTSFIVWFFAFYLYNNYHNWGKKIITALTFITIIQTIYVFSYYQSNQRLSYQHDVLLANRIYDRVVQLNSNSDTPIPLDFYGQIRFQTNLAKIDGSPSGYSFFEWDNGNKHRMFSFMRMIGFNNITLADQTKVNLISPIEYADMPIWPKEGSVKVVDGITLIKLSNIPGAYDQRYSNVFISHINDNTFFDLRKESDLQKAASIDMVQVSKENNIFESTSQDPQLIFDLENEKVKQCKIVEITIDLKLEKPALFQVFYMQYGDTNFSGEKSRDIYQPSALGKIHILIGSDRGFGKYLRIDPVNNQQKFQIDDLLIGCVREGV